MLKIRRGKGVQLKHFNWNITPLVIPHFERLGKKNQPGVKRSSKPLAILNWRYKTSWSFATYNKLRVNELRAMEALSRFSLCGDPRAKLIHVVALAREFGFNHSICLCLPIGTRLYCHVNVGVVGLFWLMKLFYCIRRAQIHS